MALVNHLPSGCWRWIGSRDKDGYGRFKVDGGMRRAHRWAYEQTYGEIPPGWEVDHLCQNPWCVNPEHLDMVTQWEHRSRKRLYKEAAAITTEMEEAIRAGAH